MPSDLQVSNIKDLTGSNTGLSIASDGQVTISQNNPTLTLGSNATFPQYAVLKSTTSNATSSWPSGSFSTTSSTYVVVDDASGNAINSGAFTFTAGNQLLIILQAQLIAYGGGGDVGVYLRISNADTDNNNFISRMADTEALYISSSASGATPQMDNRITFVHTDSPSGTSVTYYFQIRASHGGTVAFNRGLSSVTIMEIQA